MPAASARRQSLCIPRSRCPEGAFDIILESSQLGLQIHESIGHPIELDRVLGMEAILRARHFLRSTSCALCGMAAIS
jgi:TldD protein